MKFADLHCDTPYKSYNVSSGQENLHISKDKYDFLEKYIQVSAIWSDKGKDNDTCYDDFYKIKDHFSKQTNSCFCTSKDQLVNSNVNLILAVEDARLLNNQIERLQCLKDNEVKFITLVWKDISCIGGGWNTDIGLTDFGAECVEYMFQNNIIPDVSHGSRKLVYDVSLIAAKYNKPFCATHSNSFHICNHKRNLTDTDAKIITDSGGLIGISLYPPHISEKVCDCYKILKHIEHYIDLLGENSVAFGCDFDGVDYLPKDIQDISSVKHIYNLLYKEFGPNITENVFFYNVYNFLLKNF